MSNLGVYQWMTTASKKVGGPVNFLLLVASTGAATYKSCEIVIKKCMDGIKQRKLTKGSDFESEEKTYFVTTSAKTNEGLQFVAGDKFKALGSDGDSVLIEKIGDKNNPYFVSTDLLREISDY